MFGQAGQRVLIEQFLDGEELTIMAFTDGRTVVPMLPAQDHKRVGMAIQVPTPGAWAPIVLRRSGLWRCVSRSRDRSSIRCRSLISHGLPVSRRCVCRAHDCERDTLRAGVQCSMGDPETQVVLPLLKTDLLDVMEAVIEHRLDQLRVDWHNETAVCVVMTSGVSRGLSDRPCDSRITVYDR